jgi:hypothetical protein
MPAPIPAISRETDLAVGEERWYVIGAPWGRRINAESVTKLAGMYGADTSALTWLLRYWRLRLSTGERTGYASGADHKLTTA